MGSDPQGYLQYQWDTERADLRNEIHRLKAIVRSQVDALNYWRAVYDATVPGAFEARVRAWIESRIGIEHMHPKERAMQLLEEAIELAQAEGIDIDMVAKQVAHIFDGPAGDPSEELAGVVVCAYGWCAARGEHMADLAAREIARIERAPLDKIRGSLARKKDADLVTFDPEGEPV
jgi:hypothetical protein